MGDSSETVFNNELFLRDCTCPKPECNELEIEINNGIQRAVTRVSVADVENMDWYLKKWADSKKGQ